ncbi:MAG: hypothetical protein K1X57_01850 [Gemmataceae bacterium]|nr:hypothetical protein [Gemmataceae bacterium]
MRLRKFVLDVMTDHFARLGLTPGFALDPAELQRRYLVASRSVHPDLAGEAAGADAARLNEAFAVLRDPFRRGDHLVTLLGGPGPNEVRQPPAEFLEEMLELRMAIAGGATPELAATVDARRAAVIADLAAGFASDTPDLTRLRQQLNALKFLDGLLRDLHEG